MGHPDSGGTLTRLQDATSQKAVILILATMRTWNLILNIFYCLVNIIFTECSYFQIFERSRISLLGLLTDLYYTFTLHSGVEHIAKFFTHFSLLLDAFRIKLHPRIPPVLMFVRTYTFYSLPAEVFEIKMVISRTSFMVAEHTSTPLIPKPTKRHNSEMVWPIYRPETTTKYLQGIAVLVHVGEMLEPDGLQAEHAKDSHYHTQTENSNS
jgi:hypothetical protein